MVGSLLVRGTTTSVCVASPEYVPKNHAKDSRFEWRTTKTVVSFSVLSVEVPDLVWEVVEGTGPRRTRRLGGKDDSWKRRDVALPRERGGSDSLTRSVL